VIVTPPSPNWQKINILATTRMIHHSTSILECPEGQKEISESKP
jgi:hypothetical protein